MAIVHFDSLDACDLVEVEFITLDGRQSAARLFVDSGFTGASSFVPSDEFRALALANLSSAQATGALTGRQERVLVHCSIPAISFERNLEAILTEIEPLSLPLGFHGMAGLTFLRQFQTWTRGRNRGGSIFSVKMNVNEIASHHIAARPSHLAAKVAYVLAWFERYRRKGK